MNFLLKVDSAYSDNLLLGGKVVLIGVATVFSILAILWAFLTLFKVVFHDMPAKKATQVAAPTPVQEAIAEPVVYDTDDEEIVAVIAAAIAMAESESNGAKFTVVSFRRK